MKRNNKLLRKRWANKIKPDVTISGSQVREEISQVIQPYSENNKAVSASRSQYINALISRVEKSFGNGNRLPVGKLRFAIKACTPSRQDNCWGDTWFANSLARAFVKLGHKCEVHFRDEWDQLDNHADVVIHIKGRFRYIPKPHSFNIIWIISHPELHTIEEINRFDAVFCASRLYLEFIRNRVEPPCFYLPQASDEDIFKPVDSVQPKDIDILFVGTNYGGKRRRKVIQDVLDTGKKYNLWVIGKFWHGFISKEYYKAEYVDWDQLPALYSRAKIVLNDHHETMREFGFINNRTYDLAALKSFQISDYVRGMEELGIVTYQTPNDLTVKLDYFLKCETARGKIANMNHKLCRNFTFGNVAREITRVINGLLVDKKAGDNKFTAREQKSFADISKPPKSGDPKVSVIVPCYDSERFLPECLKSITNQTMQEWELFLLDDGSTDGTRRIIEDYSRIDKRIRPLFFEDNKGPYVRRNSAIEQAASGFIVIQDADDIMRPGKLEILYNEITKDEQLGIVGSFYHKFFEEFEDLEYSERCELRVLTHEEIMQSFRSRWDFCWHGSAIIRKTMFDAVGLYDENPFGSDSFWLAKAAEYACHTGNVRFKNIPEYLTLRRIHADSQTGALPTFDPRSRRVKFVAYCENNLRKIREGMRNNPGTDIAAELRRCECSDFTVRYGHLFHQWENEPLDKNTLTGLVNKAVASFNNRRYVTCISLLNGLEMGDREIAEKLKNYDLLRAMAYFAVNRKQESRSFLDRELQTHRNAAAKKFVCDCFEKRSVSDVQTWCHENGRSYNLQIIDTERMPVRSFCTNSKSPL